MVLFLVLDVVVVLVLMLCPYSRLVEHVWWVGMGAAPILWGAIWWEGVVVGYGC